MAEAQEINELLRKDSELANPSSDETPELDEEGNPIEEPELDEEGNPIEAEEKTEEEPEEELQPKSKAKVQARIDELISDSKATKELLRTEREARLALEAKLNEKPKAEEKPKVTWEQLQAVIDDPAQEQYHNWAKKEQQLLIAREVSSEKLSVIETSNQEKMDALASMQKAIDNFPELKEKGELWQRANQIFEEKGLATVKDGQSLAVELADAERNRGVVKTAKSTKLKLDKVNAGKQLLGGSKKVTANISATKEKLMQEARKTGNFTHYMKYISEHGG